MARFVSDQNKVLGVYESGTYGAIKDSGSTFWIGQVTEHSIDDSENLLENRYLGTSDRNFDYMAQGPRDVTGTLTYHVQDMRLVAWAIGSVNEVVGTGSSVHFATEIDTDVWQSPFTSGTGQLNAPISFTIEDSKQSPGTGRNFIRTINGAVPNVTTITASRGEKVHVNIDYIGQTLTYSSGATSSVTEQTGIRPYLWSDCSLTIGGSSIDTAKEVSLEINQNIEAPHYLNGSRDVSVPYPQNREYTLNVTMDLDGTEAAMLYNEYYKGGSKFNAVFDLNADSTTGSQHTIFTMSGCYVTSMDNPSTNEGIVESTVVIRPESLTGSIWDCGSAYNPF